MPVDVWNMIANKASIDKVYIVRIKCVGSSSVECGVFKDKEEAYKIACNIIGNHCIVLNIQKGGNMQLFRYMYFQEQLTGSVFNINEPSYPKTYEQMFKTITKISTTFLNSKVKIIVDEKQVI